MDNGPTVVHEGFLFASVLRCFRTAHRACGPLAQVPNQDVHANHKHPYGKDEREPHT